MGACGSAPAERRTSKVDPETVVNGEPQESSKAPAVDPTPSSGSAAGGHTQTQDSSSSERKEEQSREHDTKKEPEQESKKEELVIKTEPETKAAAPSTADDAAASPEVSHKQDATADSEPTVKKSKKSRKDKREKKDKRRKKDKKDKHKQRHDQDGTSISGDKQIRTQTDQSVGRAGEIGDEEDSASHSTGGSNSTGDSNSTTDSKPVTSSWDDSDDDDDAQRYNRNKSIDVSNVVLVPKEDISGVKGFGGTRCTIGGRELDGKLTHKLKCARCGYRVYRFPGRRCVQFHAVYMSLCR